MLLIVSLSFVLFLLLPIISAQQTSCQSFGVDIINGGTYCINTLLSEDFAFGSLFQGCTTTDSPGDITPIVVDPNSDEYFCSDIPITPEGVDFTSYCNVAGDELPKSSMLSGNYTIVIEGETFAYQRTFGIIAQPPIIMTQTPTVTFSITQTPTSTVTSTSTNVFSSALQPSTVTSPSSTKTVIVTSTPAKVTTTSTFTQVITIPVPVFSKTTTTQTVTTGCNPGGAIRDLKATIQPTKASLAAAATAGKARRNVPAAPKRPYEARDLQKRGPDPCLTTVTASSILTQNVTITAAPTTQVITTIASLTTTITPPPVTAYLGVYIQTTTTTLPTPTRTIVVQTFSTTKTTRYIFGIVTATKKVPCASAVS